MKSPRTIDFAYADHFETVCDFLPGPFEAQRGEALGRLRESGLPSTRVEAWKYTNLNLLAGAAVRPAPIVADLPASIRDALPEGDRLVFVNGRFDAERSRGDGVAWSTQPEAILDRIGGMDENVLHDINTAFMTDGAVVRVGADSVRETPVHLVFVGVGDGDAMPAQHTRTVIVLEKGAKATVVETHIGVAGTAYWSNPVVRIDVEEGAALTHVKVQDESLAATHLALTEVRVGAGASYEGLVVTCGAALSRNEVRVVLAGGEATCNLNGVYLLREKQHADHTTWIDHAVANCTSDEVYKGVLSGRAHGVFQGRIIVHPDAQKTIGNQLNRTILLSPDCEMSTKPELEIYADDVKCSHGATTGELDDDEMFYLRARGIPMGEARRLLVRGFIAELLENVVEPVHTRIQDMVDHWLELENTGDGQ